MRHNLVTQPHVARLANGPLARRPVLALALLLVLFGFAGAIAPEITGPL